MKTKQLNSRHLMGFKWQGVGLNILIFILVKMGFEDNNFCK